MTRFFAPAALGGICLLCTALLQAQSVEPPPQEELASAIQRTLEENMKALNEEALDAAMATIHSRAPGFRATRDQTRDLFEGFDLVYRMTEFAYVGTNGGYAVARVRQETREKEPTGGFRPNAIEAMQILREEGGIWKVWTTAILEIRQLESEK